MVNPLQARALWLVGVCGGELKPEEWGDAFKLAAAYMGAKDLVVRSSRDIHSTLLCQSNISTLEYSLPCTGIACPARRSIRSGEHGLCLRACVSRRLP